jgi:hypothetical protein
MTTANLQVRRASVDDLPQLISLWQQEQLPWATLEKRFKEFQVVERSGELLGGIGLEVLGTEGRLHSETFAYAEQSDSLREMLWERMQVVARNFGLVRLWTQFPAPYWHRTSLQEPSHETLAKLPPSFTGDPHPWRVLQLKDEVPLALAAERVFAVFRELEKQRTARVYRHASVLKLLAGVLVLLVFGLLVFGILAWFKARSHLQR